MDGESSMVSTELVSSGGCNNGDGGWMAASRDPLAGIRIGISEQIMADSSWSLPGIQWVVGEGLKHGRRSAGEGESSIGVDGGGKLASVEAAGDSTMVAHRFGPF